MNISVSEDYAKKVTVHVNGEINSANYDDPATFFPIIDLGSARQITFDPDEAIEIGKALAAAGETAKKLRDECEKRSLVASA